MSDDLNNNLSDAERDALRAAADVGPPPAELEARTIRELKQHGLIRDRKGGWVMKVSAAVGALVTVALIFVAGVTVGKKDSGTPATQTTQTAEANLPQFMLLMYDDNTPERMAEYETHDERFYQAMIDEYRQWAVKMQKAGYLVSAEKLKHTALRMSGLEGANQKEGLPEGRVLGGYFLIRASSLAEAQQLAGDHPHLKYGGEIEIRPLDLHD